MRLFFLTCAIFFHKPGYGQTISGRIKDTAQDQYIGQAVVALLQKDSSLFAFTRSGNDGKFVFEKVPEGEYILVVTRPTLSDFGFPLTIHRGEVRDVGNVTPLPKSKMMTEVLVTAKDIRPRMNGDTLEFNTGHIRMSLNANVEELLRRLPGVQVDQNGVITVNGQRIDRVTVDGEDFLGGNATLVTRNFNADMINKVQVLDRKSRNAEFTGVDDGVRTKTLNVKLKENSKRGHFVKTEAGSDAKNYYNVNGLLGAFKESRQLGIVAMKANDGSTDAGGNGISTGPIIMGGDPLGASAGGGIPKSTVGGAHYANHWTKSKERLSGNYQYGRMSTAPASTSEIIQSLPGSTYAQHQNAVSHNTREQHSGNAEYEFHPDSLNAFLISFRGSTMHGGNQYHAQGSSSFNDTLANINSRDIFSDVTGSDVHGSVLWNLNLGRGIGRSLSVVTELNSTKNSATGNLVSRNQFFNKDASLHSSDTTDQKKIFQNKDLNWKLGVNLLRPLWKATDLVIGYDANGSHSRSVVSTFGKKQDVYDNFIDSLSSHYEYNTTTHSVLLNIQGTYGKLSYSLNNSLIFYTNSQSDNLKNLRVERRYVYFNPYFDIHYNMDNYKGFAFLYKRTFQPPAISQLLPAQNNADPLHITLGNDDLQPMSSHYFEIQYHYLKPVSINVGARFEMTDHSFSDKSYIDSLGRQLTQTINVEGTLNAGLFGSVNGKTGRWDIQYSLAPYWYLYRSVNYVNLYLNHTDNSFYGMSVNLNKYVADKFYVQCNFLTIYTTSKSSITSGQNNHYWSETINGGASVFIFRKYQLNTTANYSWRQSLGVLDKPISITTWNAYVSRTLLKNQLTLIWQINDILGVGRGISRDISSNLITENTYKALGRYWMFKASYRITRHRKLN